LEQVTNGIAVRMAVLYLLAGSTGATPAGSPAQFLTEGKPL